MCLILCLCLNFDSLTVRGEKTDSVVVCTNNKTYEMREAETSNSLLLLPTCTTEIAQAQAFLVERYVLAVCVEKQAY